MIFSRVSKRTFDIEFYTMTPHAFLMRHPRERQIPSPSILPEKLLWFRWRTARENAAMENEKNKR